MADKVVYDDDSIDKTPSTVNGWRISYGNGYWRAVKDSTVGISHKNKATVVTWAKKN